MPLQRKFNELFEYQEPFCNALFVSTCFDESIRRRNEGHTDLKFDVT